MIRPGSFLACALPLVASLGGLSAARAQNAPPVLPMPKDCGASSANDIANSVLPNVAEALRTKKRIVILAIGATSATMHGPVRGGYYAIVKKSVEAAYKPVKVEIVHRGFSGELAENAAGRIKTEVALTGADLVLWQLGTADALARVPPEDFAEDVTNQIRWLKARKVDVILVGVRYSPHMVRDSSYMALRETVAKVAAAEKVIRLGRFEAERALAQAKRDKVEGFSLTDGTEASYVCTAEYLARTITAGIFVRKNPPQDGPPPPVPAPNLNAPQTTPGAPAGQPPAPKL